MTVNVEKTSVIYIRRNSNLLKLELRDLVIKCKPTIRYLRCRIDRLRTVPQEDHCVLKAKATRAVLYPILAPKLSMRAKLSVYKMYICLRLIYAAPVWYGLASATQMRQLQLQQNLALRMIVGAGHQE